MAESDPPGSVIDDIPSRQDRAKSLDLDPANGLRKIRRNKAVRERRSVQGKPTSDGYRQALEEIGYPPKARIIMDLSRGPVTVDFHPLDFIERKGAAEKDNTEVTEPLSEEILIAQSDHIIGPGYPDSRG